MAINIKNAEVESLLDELKAETGKGVTEIVLDLARREVQRRRRLREIDQRSARVRALSARYRARLSAQPASPDEIIGYGDDGLPR
jgi:antitoxin VapB